MDWSDQPASQPVHAPPGDAPFAAHASASFSPEPSGSAAAATPDRGSFRLGGIRRTIATALLAVGLLTVGGVAVVFAADPSATPAPKATTPSTNGGSTAPSTGTTPSTTAPRGAHHGAGCPNMGTGSGGGSTSPNASTAPSTNGSTSSPSTSDL
jgi:hypothetical protein